MALLTPSILDLIWYPTRDTSQWFQGSTANLSLLLPPDGLFRAGNNQGGQDIGCTLIKFDADTGEPLAWASHSMASGGTNMQIVCMFHVPDEQAVVLFGTETPSTFTSHRVYAQRVEYDVAATTLTAGALATWSPNPSSTNPKDRYEPNCTSSTTVDVFAWGVFNTSMATMNLTAGTVGSATTYTLASLFG